MIEEDFFNDNLYIKNLLKKENVCPIKIEEYFKKIVKILNEDLKHFCNKTCDLPHDHFALNISKNADKNCLEEMIKNYIYSITVNKSKDFITDMNLNSDEININKEDFKKVANFINENDNENFTYSNNKNFNENYSKLINNENLLKKKPIFLLKKVKRENAKNEKKEKKTFIKSLDKGKFSRNDKLEIKQN